MTTDQLKNFLAVAESINFHKASENIYIAQPALSRQIKNLEEEMVLSYLTEQKSK